MSRVLVKFDRVRNFAIGSSAPALAVVKVSNIVGLTQSIEGASLMTTCVDGYVASAYVENFDEIADAMCNQ
ncbi:hypothetical protein [Yersinia phage MHG19]|nr:hypothetical protein [Yersinia phage MHG19]